MNHVLLEQPLLGPRSTMSGGEFQVQMYSAVDTYKSKSQH